MGPIVGGVSAVAVVVALGVAGSGLPTPTQPMPSLSAGPTPSPSATPSRDALDGFEFDALQQEHIDELRDFIQWLEDNDADGFVGEVGWPSEPDSGWTTLGEAWYLLADDAGLWTAGWAAGSAWPDEYPLVIYGGDESLSVGSDQAAVIESFLHPRIGDTAADGGGGDPGSPPEVRHGVNIAGLEFGTDEGFSHDNPGELGTDYFAEPSASYQWLAGQGIDMVRLPVRWERLQPALDGALDETYVAIVTDQLDAAAAAGIDVILDLHNYGRYLTLGGELLIGSGELDEASLIDVWLRIAATWGDHEAMLGYGLMNEPHDLGEGEEDGAARMWERVTQQILSALRDADDDHLVLVAGYDWSSLARWSSNHPTGWIEDPADNFRYEAHHYWDSDGAGWYPEPYENELAAYADS